MKQNSRFLKELLNGAEVEWRALGEVADYEQPTPYLVSGKVYDNNFKTPVLTAGKTFILGYTNEEQGIYRASEKPVILFDDFTTAHRWINFDFKIKSSATKLITSKNEERCLLKYIHYWLDTLPSEIGESDHKRQWISSFSNKKIPLPPLAVQEEIVKILDNFTELTAELTARKKQYEYYRDLLLSFTGARSNLVEWKKLGELGELIRGNGLQKKDFTPEGIPAIHYGQIYTYYGTWADKTISFVSSQTAMKLKKANHGDVLMAGVSENVQDVLKPLAWLGGEIAFSGDMFAFHPDDRLSGKFLTYLLQTKAFSKFKEKNAQGAKVIRVKSSAILEYKIPLPPLEEQERIVGILDQFDTLANSISEGLPREIELRQKQYEYYRDLLLNFKRVENVDDLAR